MIRVDGVHKAFGAQKVLDGVSLQVSRGEVAALLGLSGTGKSVLLLHLVGLIRPDQGRVEVDGLEMSSLAEPALLTARRRIGYLFQDGALYDFMTVGENVAFPLREHTRLTAADIRSRVRERLRLVDLAGAEDKFPAELSGGMRKRAALARAMIMDAKVLLCDEPTSGLDPVRSRDISMLIRDLVRHTGSTALATTHDVANSFRMADRVFLLDQGKIAASGSAAELRASGDPFVRELLGA